MNEMHRMIIEFLNENETISNDLSDGETITVLDVELTYSEDAEMHSEDVSACLTGKDVLITREGRKQLSYGNWVDTSWVTDWII